jgi:Fe-S oxidoreductase
MHVIHRVRESLTGVPCGGKTALNNSLLGDGISEESVWNCTTCFACQEECPNGIEHVHLMIELRRHLLHEGRINSSGAQALEGVALQSNPWGGTPKKRCTWTEGRKVPRIQDGEKVDILFWVGCAGAFDSDVIKITHALIDLFERAGVAYAILGEEENCCGDPARRMGEEGLWQALARRNLDIFERYQFNKILTTCPHCYNTFRNEYTQLAGGLQVVHHSEFLRDLIRDDRIRMERGWDVSLTFHDPCYLGRYNGQYQASRDILRAVPDARLIETDPCGKRSHCCGAGGGQFWIQSEKGQRMEELRLGELLHTGSGTIATACPYCNIVLKAAASTREGPGLIRVLDIAEIATEASLI